MKRAKNRGKKDNVIYEKHHIFPQSIFGKNNNIVYLEPREHMIVHRLLWKYYGKLYGEDNFRTIKMLKAFWQMSHRKGVKISSKTYQKIKSEYILLRREEAKKWIDNPMKKQRIS